MQLTSKTFAALRNVSMAIVLSLAACPAALAQITVTNATFPVAGDVLKTAIASNPSIGIAAYGPPGFGLFWDLSGLQPGVLKNTSFQPASQGTVGGQVPGAELFAVTSPGTEEYYNVTANKFEIQYSYGKFYDVIPNYLAQYSPLMTERNAPMNFFDIFQSSTSLLAGSVCVPLDPGFECSFPLSEFPPALVAALPTQPSALRYRVEITRIETVDAYGTISIPGGTYNVLRVKRTEYLQTSLDGKYPPLGWLDITNNAIQAGFQGLGVDTTLTYFFYNDVVKEPIAAVTLNDEQNAATQVIYKYNAPANPPSLSINDVTQTEGNSGSSNFNFTVSLSAPAPAGGVTFNIATANNTATTANSDYVAKSLTSQTIAAGSSTYTFNVTVNGDAVVEPNETFFVNVTNVTGATVSDGQGLGTITNDDLSCAAPTGLTTTNITSTSALLNWSPVAGAKTYKILYKTSAGTVWTTVSRNSSYLSYRLTGLTPSTAYVWKMRTVCTSGAQSSLTLIKRFTTKAAVVAGVANASEADVTYTAGFSIYPNPARHFFIVDMRSNEAVTGKAEIQVISALGKMVYKENTAVNKGALKKQINLPADIAAGYYLVRVVIGERVFSSKLMIQK
ncbi:hypothetical protein BH10BAC2_BH10BAC2_22750 [soil metagenome]